MHKSDMDTVRIRILALYELLQTAAAHPGYIGMEQLRQSLSDRLELNGLDRRTVYRDLYLLDEVSGLNILYDKSLRAYKVSRRDNLSKAELSILINAVLSARFDSRSETQAMADKLYRLAGYEKMPTNAHPLENRVKLSKDGDTLAKLDLLREAMDENIQVLFDYRKYNVHKELVTVRFDCRVSPYKVLWQNDMMYLVGHFAGSGFAHYRIERICNLQKTKVKRAQISEIIGYGQQFDEAEYLRRHASLSSGQLTMVTIRFSNDAVNDIFDFLGRAASIRDNGDGTFTLHDEVYLNRKFIRWLVGFGAVAEVVKPEALKHELAQIHKKAWEIY